MKTKFNYFSNLIIFTLIILFLSLVNKVYSQDKKECKKIIKLEVNQNDGKSIEKRIEIKGNEDGTFTYKEYENGELVKEENITEDELKNFTDEEDDSDVNVFVTPDSNHKMIWIEKDDINLSDNSIDLDGIMENVEVVLDNLDEDIDMDKVIRDLKGKLLEFNVDVQSEVKEHEYDLQELKNEWEEKKAEIEELFQNEDLDGLVKKLHKQNDRLILKFKDLQGDTSFKDGEENIIFMKDIPDDIHISPGKRTRKVHEIIVIERMFRVADFDKNSPVLVKNNLKLPDLKFYPNPSHGEFTVEFSNPKSKPVSIVIYDLNGKVLFKEDIIGEAQVARKIDAKIPGKGTYILRIEQGNKTLSKKLIIE